MELSQQEQGSTSVARTDETVIRHLVESINHAWRHLRGPEMTETLKACIAEDVVMRGPGFALMGKGRDFMVQSYHDFVAQAEIKDFSTLHLTVDVSDGTAVAQYRWKMVYALNGEDYTEQGHDVLCFRGARGSGW